MSIIVDKSQAIAPNLGLIQVMKLFLLALLPALAVAECSIKIVNNCGKEIAALVSAMPRDQAEGDVKLNGNVPAGATVGPYSTTPYIEGQNNWANNEVEVKWLGATVEIEYATETHKNTVTKICVARGHPEKFGFAEAFKITNNKNRKTIYGIKGQTTDTSVFRMLKSLYNRVSEPAASEWIPIGTVKHLRIYPVKSCKGQEVFSFLCGPRGGSCFDLHDREFLAINGKTGLFLTARAFPKMILMECKVTEGVLTVGIPGGRSVSIILDDVINNDDVRRGVLFYKMATDGLDCGDAVGELIDEFLGIEDTRLIYHRPHLYTERAFTAQQNWWNNPVPKRTDLIRYADLSPFMITTEASLNDLNSRLDTPVPSLQFRANIVVDKCPAWDEDRWSEVRIGEAQLQCYKPCTRCVLSTVHPDTGQKDAAVQPLKKLREFRLAPEGKMREAHGQSPIFGVNAGLVRPGYIHVGQTVYVKYKPSAF